MKQRILIIADSIFRYTGFSSIARELCQYLIKDGHDVAHLALWDTRPNNSIQKFNQMEFDFKIYGCRTDKFSQFCLTEYLEILNDYKPTLIIAITDIWIANEFMKVDIPKMFYFHIEGEPLPKKTSNLDWIEAIMNIDYIVTPGEFGRQTILNRFKKMVDNKEIPIGILLELENKISIIPNGINLNQFKPLENKTQLKTALLGKPGDTFIIGFFGRQNARKNVPQILEAFSKWPNRPENAYLYLHTPIHENDGWDLLTLISDLNIKHRVILNNQLKVGEGITVDILNGLYNACDVVVNVSNEGFGQTCCVLPGTMVRTNTGYRAIETLKIGDMVNTYIGKWKPIQDVIKKKYNGEMLTIHTDNNIPFDITPGHVMLCDSNRHKMFNLKNGQKFYVLIWGQEAKDLKVGGTLYYTLPPRTNYQSADQYTRDIKKITKNKNYITSSSLASILLIKDAISTAEKPKQTSICKVMDDYAIRIDKTKTIERRRSSSINDDKTYRYFIKIPSKITKITKYNYEGLVYNLSVADDLSYNVNGLAAVHNCQALAAGVPVIIMNSSEQAMFKKGTMIVEPIAHWVEPKTNIRRAIPNMDQLMGYYQKAYDKKIDDIISEARYGVSHLSWELVSKQWTNLIEKLPATSKEYTWFTPYNKIETKEETKPVSIIICTKDKVNLLKQCIDSIIKHTKTQYEIIINDTGSTEKETKEFYKNLNPTYITILKTLPNHFNFSKSNNFAVTHAKYDTLLFLNNDTMVLTEDWLSKMQSILADPKVAIVGPKLVFPNGAIQHAGVVIGYRGIASHIFIGEPENKVETMFDRQVSSVTGACLMIKKSIFEEVGKFDEDYIIEFQDIDLCLKALKKDYKIVYTNEAKLIHLAGVSRGNPKVEEAKNDRGIFCTRWYDMLTVSDPFAPNFMFDKFNMRVINYWKQLWKK